MLNKGKEEIILTNNVDPKLEQPKPEKAPQVKINNKLPKVADKISNAEDLETSTATANSKEEKKIVKPD
ncbi:MAG: hypothetical protein ACKO96_31950 [Flammeovirgaceae bacterium]